MSPQDTFTAWVEAQKALESLKARELELRLAVVTAYFPDAAVEGTHNLDLNDGWKLKLTSRVNRKMENAKGETDSIAKQLPPEVAEKVIAWKPELKLRGYKSLQPEYRALIDSVVTTTPGTPGLALVPPKVS